VTYTATTPEAAMAAACMARGLDTAGATLLSHSSNAVYHLPGVGETGAVARITTGADSLARVQRTQAVTTWLVSQHDYPATAPLPDVAPVVVDATTMVSWWIYYPQPDRPAPTSIEMGRVLRKLHDIDHPPADIELPQWTPLESLDATIDDPHLSTALNDDDRAWLEHRIEQIRHQLDGLDWPLGSGLIHGDAWAGNLLWDTARTPAPAVLGDWDWVSIGPREVDLIPTWHATIRYGRPAEWATSFAAEYGYDLSAWPGFDLLLQMRDLVQVTGPMRRAPRSDRYAAAFRQRLGDIRAGDRMSSWRMPAAPGSGALPR